jgi:putative glutamine amidotransferase
MKLRSLASREHRPLIGVTTSEVRPKERVNPVPEGEPIGKEMALGTTDLDPALYAAEPHPELGPIEPELDRFELAIAARADAREMPILAICRGTQALNIVRGGALHQHLPDISTEIPHRQTVASTEPSHAVAVEPGSQLAEAIGGTEVDLDDVNSFHHQAIDRLGDGLRISARAPDGTVEAIEDPSRRFLIGVQWHAETLVHREAEAELFRRFVDACRDDGAEYERAAKREVA